MPLTIKIIPIRDIVKMMTQAEVRFGLLDTAISICHFGKSLKMEASAEPAIRTDLS